MLDSTDKIKITTSTTRPQIRLRRAILRDVNKLLDMIERSLYDLGSDFYTTEQLESASNYMLEIESQLIIDGTLYVVEIGQRIIACGAWSYRGAPYNSVHAHFGDRMVLDPARHPAKLQTFYVHPDWTRRGFAGRLMKECLAKAWDGGFDKVEVLATLMSVPLFQKFGFRQATPMKIGFPDGVSMQTVHMVSNSLRI